VDDDLIIEVGEASEALVEILNRNGVRELFVMPGDAFPILEAIARLGSSGRPVPRVITCPHEVVALSAAHGHFMVSGRPQACLFHVDVGLQMAGGMLHNAQRGRAAVVILSGRTPVTFDGTGRPARVIDVHWMQDRSDQASTARDYVKWHYDLLRAEALPHVMQRAFQVADTEPTGPVYVSLGAEMLVESPTTVRLLSPARYRPPHPPVPDARSLQLVADALASAEHPVAIAGYVGRSDAGFHALTDFAELAAVPVLTRGGRANMSSTSPMYMGAGATDLLGEADVVLFLDVDVPHIPLFAPLRDDAWVIQIDIDPLKADIPIWGFPVDLPLHGSTAEALPAIGHLLADQRTDEQEASAARRRAACAARHEEFARARTEAADAEASQRPISVRHLSRCIAELVDEQTIVVDDSTTALATTVEYIPTTNPGSYFQPMGSSMGWGSGAALGAKLAAPEKTVINLNAEGNLLSGVSEAALWAAVNAAAPYLIVVFNNAQYAAIKLGLAHSYPDSYALRSGAALNLPSPPDFAAIARACGCHGERVENPADVRAALKRGLAAVAAGMPAVVDVAVAGP
jgi:acetolactate synthase-1/2/3 large subunit